MSIPHDPNPPADTVCSAEKSCISRFVHDIRDQNNSIMLGTDLLLKFWEALTAHLDEMTLDGECVKTETYQELVGTVPVVINGIRKASMLIEETIDCRFTASPSPDDGTGAGKGPEPEA